MCVCVFMNCVSVFGCVFIAIVVVLRNAKGSFVGIGEQLSVSVVRTKAPRPLPRTPATTCCQKRKLFRAKKQQTQREWWFRIDSYDFKPVGYVLVSVLGQE